MAMLNQQKLIVIDDFNAPQHQDFVGPDGLPRAKGLVAPTPEMRANPNITAVFNLPLLTDEQIKERLAQQKAGQRSSLIDVRNRGNFGQPIPPLDQNGKGYCWAHSSTSAMLLQRARDNEPFVDLSAYAVACIIKNYRDEGGWGDLSLKFMEDRGVPTSEFWPQRSMSRANDNPTTWANAAKHKAQTWCKLAVNSRADLKRMMATCYLLGIPTVNDYDRWSHSVCGAALLSWEPFSHLILNSWGDWSDNGFGELKGDSWLPDDCWALITASASTD